MRQFFRVCLVLVIGVGLSVVASESQAGCGGARGGLRGVARAPAKVAGGALRGVKGLLGRTRFADGDGKILRKS
jgi:hypothetical protein